MAGDVLKRNRRHTWRWRWNELGDALGVGDRANLEMHLEAVIVRTWRPRSSELRDALGGGQSGGGRSGRRRDESWDSIHGLTRNRGNVMS